VRAFTLGLEKCAPFLAGWGRIVHDGKAQTIALHNHRAGKNNMSRDPNQTFAQALFFDNPSLRDEARSTPSLPLLTSELRSVTLDGTTYYVAEGDLLLDADELAVYALKRDKPERALDLGEGFILDEPRRLIGILENGQFLRWPDGTVLTYCVPRENFSSGADKEYAAIVENMRLATQDWMSTCNIRFEHKKEADEKGASRSGLKFTVKLVDANGAFYAAAFFPNSPPARHHVNIDLSYFGNHSYDRVGILRHELGHVLGFRHEHIVSGAPAECPKEPLTGTKSLIDKYDPKSVMHYFCGGVGSRDLKITQLDVAGSQKLYGPPTSAPSATTPRARRNTPVPR
jgi:hypothetical protein